MVITNRSFDRLGQTCPVLRLSSDLYLQPCIVKGYPILTGYLGEDEKYPTIQELIDYHNKQTKHILHYDTQRHYKTSQKYILEYVKNRYKTKDYYLRDLNYGFVMGFEYFLRSYSPKHPQPSICNNTIMKHIQRLRKMVTMAFHIEWIERDPFVKFKTKLVKTDRDFLSREELENIEKFTSPLNRLNVTKDLFIFICYTGIAYGDIMQLTEKDIVKGQDQNLWI